MTLNVFLDANVLVPIAVTDVLMRLGTAGLIDPRWSEQVLDEVEQALLRVHPDMPKERIKRRLEFMASAFEYAMTEVDDQTVSSLQLPDADDRHVLAGAILSEATIIVTNNTKDFPASALAEHGIQAKTPNRLLRDLLEAEPERTIQVIRDAASATRNPPLSVAHILESLGKAQAAGFSAAAAAWLRAHAVSANAADSNQTQSET
ncbi:MAG: PIN domain-containing protein [Bifidobacteriaceae bacterium]|jgi:predicted nucleic acid-binding protein|nr:PIN domain-containing protein [Bifidobacteriaceae bacterium]